MTLIDRCYAENSDLKLFKTLQNGESIVKSVITSLQLLSLPENRGPISDLRMATIWNVSLFPLIIILKKIKI
jgi:hypothetical protein